MLVKCALKMKTGAHNKCNTFNGVFILDAVFTLDYILVYFVFW